MPLAGADPIKNTLERNSRIRLLCPPPHPVNYAVHAFFLTKITYILDITPGKNFEGVMGDKEKREEKKRVNGKRK